MGHYFWYLGIVLFIFILAIQHYGVYSDNFSREDFQGKNILLKIAYFLYKIAYCELLCILGWIALIGHIILFSIASLVWLVQDIWEIAFAEKKQDITRKN